MDKNWKGLATKLPVQPSGALKTETLMDVYDSNALGYPLVLYHRESVELADEIQQTMGPEEWAHLGTVKNAPLGCPLHLQQLRGGFYRRLFQGRHCPDRGAGWTDI